MFGKTFINGCPPTVCLVLLLCAKTTHLGEPRAYLATTFAQPLQAIEWDLSRKSEELFSKYNHERSIVGDPKTSSMMWVYLRAPAKTCRSLFGNCWLVEVSAKNLSYRTPKFTTSLFKKVWSWADSKCTRV
jgi:hypothetical protein